MLPACLAVLRRHPPRCHPAREARPRTSVSQVPPLRLVSLSDVGAPSSARRRKPPQTVARERRTLPFWLTGGAGMAERLEEVAVVAKLAFCLRTASTSTASMAVSSYTSAAAISDRLSGGYARRISQRRATRARSYSRRRAYSVFR